MRSEESLVRELGKQIGYGRMMGLARDEWHKSLASLAGGEFAVGPCVALTVPCGCDYPCDWCNGCGWITPKVKELRDSLATPPPAQQSPRVCVECGNTEQLHGPRPDPSIDDGFGGETWYHWHPFTPA